MGGILKVKITELKGVSLVLTQTDNKTFRLMARGSKDIEEKLISEEFKQAQEKGYIKISGSEAPQKPAVLKLKTNEFKNIKEGGNE
jgi:uncharacterized protein YehS (DUF1456 family)